MRKLVALYRFVNLLSLDVVAGAIAGALFFSKVLDVAVYPYALIALGLTVWIIYTADHLRDAGRIGPDASSERHRFHHRNFRVLKWTVFVAVAADGFMVLFMRKAVFSAGIVLSLIVLVYLVAQPRLRWTKEILVAVLYTAGVLLPSISVTAVPLTISHFLLFISFGLLALTNLLMLSWFDFSDDLRDHQPSFATIMTKDVTRAVILVLTGLNFACSAFLFLRAFETGAVLILAVMNLLLLFTFMFPRLTGRNNNYRLFGDAVFLMPAIYWL